MTEQTAAERAREAHDRKEWESAYQGFREADNESRLSPADLWRLAMAAYLTGRDDEFLAVLERAHHAWLEAGEVVAAARAAFWLGFQHAQRGEAGPATGWLGRAGRLLKRAGGDHVEEGYLLIPVAHQRLGSGDPAGCREMAAKALAIGERFHEPELVALSLQLQGHARLAEGQVEEGLALLDEAMVAVTAGEVSPVIAGLLYCAVIGACRRVYELGRAHEWTAALGEWCRDQPDLVPYRGECLVYRSEILQLRGDWDGALGEARLASELSSGDPRPAAAAYYQQGEVHRLRGEYDAAEEAFLTASRLGREPQPGLALLRLARDDVDAAAAALRRALAETGDPLRRARLLPAWIEIALAAADLDEAARAADELAATAERFGADLLETYVAQARGAIALADDDALAALGPLRRALQAWQALDAPYEAARVRVLLGAACRELGDEDSSAFELDTARDAFEALGAVADAERVDVLRRRGRSGPRRAYGLTPRELEVLGLLATGRTNRAIAEELFISEKTVARHVSNIFSKLGLSSRSAATAFAYENELV